MTTQTIKAPESSTCEHPSQVCREICEANPTLKFGEVRKLCIAAGVAPNTASGFLSRRFGNRSGATKKLGFEAGLAEQAKATVESATKALENRDDGRDAYITSAIEKAEAAAEQAWDAQTQRLQIDLASATAILEVLNKAKATVEATVEDEEAA